MVSEIARTFYKSDLILTPSFDTAVTDELPFRMAVWQGAQILSSVFGGPLAPGILLTMGGIGGLHAWKWCKSDVMIFRQSSSQA
jgi:hypothetical protein